MLKPFTTERLAIRQLQIQDASELAPRQVFAETRPDNVASIRLLTKTGFYATGRPSPRPNRIEFMLR